jgi:hypothetical protein
MAKRGELAPVEVRHNRRTPGVTYQLEHVLCGRAHCRKLHGPYWYAYWKAGGRVRKRYIGRKFHTVPAGPGLGNRPGRPRKRLPKRG